MISAARRSFIAVSYTHLCLHAKTPVVDLSLFRSKPFTAGIIATAGCMFAMATLLYMLCLLYTSRCV